MNNEKFPPRSRFLTLFSRSGLRAHMTISYMSVTIGSVLSFRLLAVLASGAVSAFFSDSLPSTFVALVQQQAHLYALNAAVQAEGVKLDPTSNFIPGHPNTLVISDQVSQEYNVAVPYISTPSTKSTSVNLALLIAPNGRLVTSSYPSRYAAGMPVSSLLPAQNQAIAQALAGRVSMGTENLSSLGMAYAAVPVWSKNNQPIGAIFLQAAGPDRASIFSTLWRVLEINIVMLILVIPVGVFFGWITTRGLVRRLQHLVQATTHFAGGDYTQRVVTVHRDEIGQLEHQFNNMAEQLVENIARRQQLAEQNARLEERSRISRELHDAISQDLFSLRMLADGLQEATRAVSSSTDLRSHIAVLEQTTTSMTREMRALLLELRPTKLENLGLADALRKLAHLYSTRLGITVRADVKQVMPDVKVEHALLRISQEALANAARHSSATLISLYLAPNGKMVQLVITDNGEDFHANECSERHGLGILIMQERVQELQGTFQIETAPGQGTRIAVSLPTEEVYDTCCAG